MTNKKLFHRIKQLSYLAGIPIFMNFHPNRFHILLPIFFGLGMVFIATVILIASFGDMQAAIQNVPIFLVIIQSIYKTLELFKNRNVLNNLIDFLENDKFYSETDDNKRIMMKNTRRLNCIFCIYITAGVFAFILTIAVPLFNKAHGFPYVKGIYVPNNGYPIIYTFTTATHFYLVLLVLINDLLIGAFFIHFGGKLELYNIAISRVFDDIVDMPSKQTDLIQKRIRECVEYYNELRRKLEILNRFITKSATTQIFVSMAVIGYLAFNVAQKLDEGILSFISGLQNWIFCLVELGIYCIGGQYISTLSEQISESIYNSNWIDFLHNRSATRFVLLLLIRNHKPIEMKAGWFYTLNNESYMTLLKISYSLLSLLLNVY